MWAWGSIYKQRIFEKGKAEGKAEGIKIERNTWIDWNSRREKAIKEGLDFNEPPPINDTDIRQT